MTGQYGYNLGRVAQVYATGLIGCLFSPLLFSSRQSFAGASSTMATWLLLFHYAFFFLFVWLHFFCHL